MGKLTAKSVTALGPGRHHDGDCLLLEVRPTGSRSWLARVRHNGKRRDIGLGSASVISLARARERCREVRTAIAEGRDPLTLWKPSPPMARFFEEVAREFVEQREFSAKSRQQALTRLERYAFPRLGKLQVQSVDADNIAEALRPIWTTKPETAVRTRDLILRTLRFGRPDGALLETTLARAITDRLPAQPRNKNFAAMPYTQVPGFMAKLAGKKTMGALALQTVILTATRSGEARGATWREIDFDEAVWTVPAERMKMKRPHRIPLSPQAVAVLRAARDMPRADRKADGLVFPGATGKPLSDMTLTKILRDMNEPVTVHGMRSSFRDWAAEQTSLPGEIAEAALAHAVPNAVEAAYRRTTFFDKRREMMNAWGGYCADDGGAKVVPIRKGRG
ncbi:tyrosine-type recombinase/integrase [Tsuneonella sp. YG55]|uniref:Tyrosine-type recombinase/integrase n=1 Tax=Tsuneonella litorea TaxID=2976475 RepID=A0A9X3AJR5_9SPHN|nr:site-specific integrase [Tsuneonella litorea]MCT2557374.1 tyrosine-type recombinase/integrase [Tsuneonella litorea]